MAVFYLIHTSAWELFAWVLAALVFPKLTINARTSGWLANLGLLLILGGLGLTPDYVPCPMAQWMDDYPCCWNCVCVVVRTSSIIGRLGLNPAPVNHHRANKLRGLPVAPTRDQFSILADTLSWVGGLVTDDAILGCHPSRPKDAPPANVAL